MRRGSASWRVRVYARSGPAGRMALLLPSRAVHARVCRLAGVPERLPERPTKCCPLSSHATRANKAIQRYYLRQKASKQRLVLRCAHSPYRRAQRLAKIGASRDALQQLQASGRPCKYLQQADATAPLAAPRPGSLRSAPPRAKSRRAGAGRAASPHPLNTRGSPTCRSSSPPSPSPAPARSSRRRPRAGVAVSETKADLGSPSSSTPSWAWDSLSLADAEFWDDERADDRLPPARGDQARPRRDGRPSCGVEMKFRPPRHRRIVLTASAQSAWCASPRNEHASPERVTQVGYCLHERLPVPAPHPRRLHRGVAGQLWDRVPSVEIEATPAPSESADVLSWRRLRDGVVIPRHRRDNVPP